jgi:hypothetical protein
MQLTIMGPHLVLFHNPVTVPVEEIEKLFDPWSILKVEQCQARFR